MKFKEEMEETSARDLGLVDYINLDISDSKEE